MINLFSASHEKIVEDGILVDISAEGGNVDLRVGPVDVLPSNSIVDAALRKVSEAPSTGAGESPPS